MLGCGISAIPQALGSDFRSSIDENQSESIIDPNSINSLIPSKISVTIEPKDTGTLYLSAIISHGDIDFTRSLDDELFPFQVVNWYQLTKFTQNFENLSNLGNQNISSLVVGQLQDFDEFADLLDQARIYSDVPFNETFILEVPNRDVSFMLVQVSFSNDDQGICYGLYDGNQQTEKSETHLRLNPESRLKILESVSAEEIPPSEPLYNVIHTLVCNDLYKLGYEKCK